MNKALMSPETKLRLLTSTEEKLNDITSDIDNIRKLIKKAEAIDTFLKKENINASFNNLLDLLEFRLFIGILTLDLTSAVRIYLNAKFQYEGVFSARQIVVIINEGYKKIYNFVTLSDNGVAKLKNRNNSFWVKEIGGIIDNDLPHLNVHYNDISQKLDEYFNVNFSSLKELRDLSIHYGETAKDKSPVKVYDMIVKMDIEETFLKMIPFMEILNEMFLFTHILVTEYQKKTDNQQEKQKNMLTGMIEQLLNLRNDKNASIINGHIEKLQQIHSMFSPNTD
ncbi:hypothetical protein [Marinifilum fragile]|uniref:hypothetical protein n=1 Tax=Marinifilum fragile TaxID=570161 RepID=UPI0006D06F98|nr:hypothetical protein [Marinifilum fragile]